MFKKTGFYMFLLIFNLFNHPLLYQKKRNYLGNMSKCLVLYMLIYIYTYIKVKKYKNPF